MAGPTQPSKNLARRSGRFPGAVALRRESNTSNVPRQDSSVLRQDSSVMRQDSQQLQQLLGVSGSARTDSLLTPLTPRKKHVSAADVLHSLSGGAKGSIASAPPDLSERQLHRQVLRSTLRRGKWIAASTRTPLSYDRVPRSGSASSNTAAGGVMHGANFERRSSATSSAPSVDPSATPSPTPTPKAAAEVGPAPLFFVPEAAPS